MTYPLTDTPAWVDRLTRSSATSAPAVGELWTIGWDGTFEGVVLLTAVHRHHVLAMPVTSDLPSATEVALAVEGSRLTVWPQADTGLGLFLLHERLATTITDNQVREIKLWSFTGRELDTLTAGAGAKDDAGFGALLDHFRRLCFIEWPAEEEASLNVAATDLTAAQFAATTGIAAPRVLALWGGAAATDEERAAIMRVNPRWLTTEPGPIATELSAPAQKSLISELAVLLGNDERAARNRAQQEYALAARTESVARRNTTRAADTVRRLIAEAQGAAED